MRLIRCFRKRRSRKRANQKGVAAIFFALVFGVFLGFFMLILNTGILIYQKMRLQSSVDLAAYAAASVQASYLGNDQSQEESIRYINSQIMERYGKLLNDMQFGNVAVWPVGLPDAGSCMALCQAANLANGAMAKSLYEAAAQDLEQYRSQVAQILIQVPEKAQKAAEETLRLNIPDLSIEDGGFAALVSETTNEVDEVVRSSSERSEEDVLGSDRKNAILTFTSKKGMYLANVVGAVPHVFAYFGPACFDANYGVPDTVPSWFCGVNGQGWHGPDGFNSAALAFSRVYIKEASGNVGNLSSISDSESNAIRLFFVPNTHKPDPFVVVSAEWYPENGVFMNLENSLAATGSLFPKATKLIAVAAAEPFGGDLSTQNPTQFGTRLQSIRKVLLDPRMAAVKDDYPSLYEYFGTLGPKDDSGQPIDSPREVIKRFLH